MSRIRKLLFNVPKTSRPNTRIPKHIGLSNGHKKVAIRDTDAFRVSAKKYKSHYEQDGQRGRREHAST